SRVAATWRPSRLVVRRSRPGPRPPPLPFPTRRCSDLKLFKLAKKFHNEEDGAVTVDWVVLTAAVVGLGAAALNMVRTETKTLTESVSPSLDPDSGETMVCCPAARHVQLVLPRAACRSR